MITHGGGFRSDVLLRDDRVSHPEGLQKVPMLFLKVRVDEAPKWGVADLGWGDRSALRPAGSLGADQASLGKATAGRRTLMYCAALSENGYANLCYFAVAYQLCLSALGCVV